tara:strand:- start:412 stop:666 length:255 start_codon:yes stop_codon:yes gene_type:complete
MSKSRFVFDKLAKLLEQGLINYKDFYDEIFNILKSKRDEIIFKMKLTSQEETNVMKKRLEKLEKRIKILEKEKKRKQTKRARKF